ncbi:DNA polymerase III subunit delta' [Candidimonas sp. SYP-B2681]|uniref:DNA polymerase III subunit delta' n=1 Tax=Candidimonas sp. SYP-B2681 TaxID=2497686 RepID=UPI000F887BBE|nr:DNA polymerase III subunit delta' [Candidimonas sp. SYP-B2681]RTZ47970.1 DNA polymerase III subunit delta' [Candidimonas sp. SYP-B2681]
MSDLAQFLPWHEQLATSWLSDRERFAHAWLIHGLPGIGKRQFALAAAGSLLCESPIQGIACGHCAACLWLASGNHPDLRRIRPEAMAMEEGASASGGEDEGDAASSASKKAPSKDIRIDQLRGLTSWFNTATHRGGWRVAVLYPAQAMNHISANALLKVLEEPPEHTVFLLVADAPDRLLPTLVSRCRRMPLPVPDKSHSMSWLEGQGVNRAEEWLASAGGAPLLALQISKTNENPCPEWLAQLISPLARAQVPDIGPVADQLEKIPPEIWIDTLQRLVLDLLLAAANAPVRYFPALERQTRLAAGHASPVGLAEAAKWLAQQRATASHPLNAKLLVHATLQRLMIACGKAV